MACPFHSRQLAVEVDFIAVPGCSWLLKFPCTVSYCCNTLPRGFLEFDKHSSILLAFGLEIHFLLLSLITAISEARRGILSLI